MDFFDVIIITIQITNTIARKYASSSGESIENLVYYKDCQHKNKITTPATQLLRAPQPPAPVARQPSCPFPKMCCALSCGNDCEGNKYEQSFNERQLDLSQQYMQPLSQPPPSPYQPMMPVQPQVSKMRRKKLKGPMKMQPIPSRRDSGFSKDRIKSLIAHDDDIKKILKDLVRVTMQKVDLVELIHNRGGVDIPEIPMLSDEEYIS